MGTGLIRPAHGFPRRASGWQRRPPRAWRCRQPGRAWLAAMDQVYGFRVAIHLLEPPLTEMPGRSQVHEQPAPAAAPNGARATRHCAGPGQNPKARQKLEWMAGTGARHQVPAPHGSVSGALQERPAIDAGRPRTSAPRMVSSGRRLRACGTPGSRTRASRAGNDCDACSLAMSKGQEPFGSLQWTPGLAAASTRPWALPAPSGAKGVRLGGR
jgi:hypothetical protein